MERTRIDDLAELTAAAVEALRVALHAGDGKYPAGSWRLESVGNQINHIQVHLANVLQPLPGDSEDHLEHLLCRAAIAAALRKLQQPG